MLYSIRDLVKTRKRERGYKLWIKSLDIEKGAKLALTGPSGCGKSTTLDLLGLSLAPDSANKFIFSPASKIYAIADFWQEKRLDLLTDLRANYLGFVLQSGELLPFLTTGENMLLTAKLRGIPEKVAKETAMQYAEKLGIAHLLKALPETLSVGERQRAAITRALTASPQVILADEPTAALDPLHAEKVMNIFLECVERNKCAMILVTHNVAWAKAGGFKEISFKLEEDKGNVTAIVSNQADLT